VKNCPTLIYLFNIKVLSETPLKCPFCRLANDGLPASLLPVCVLPPSDPEYNPLLLLLLCVCRRQLKHQKGFQLFLRILFEK